MRIGTNALLGLMGLCCLSFTLGCRDDRGGPALVPGVGGAFTGTGGVGGFGSGGSFGTGGLSFGTGSSTGSSPCAPADLSVSDLRSHYIDSWHPLHTTFYAWISEEDEAALRSGAPLFPTAPAEEPDPAEEPASEPTEEEPASEDPTEEEPASEDSTEEEPTEPSAEQPAPEPAPRPHGLQQLWAWSVGHPDGLEAAIMPHFESARVSWPHPWPIKFDIDGVLAEPKLLRIDLKADAWIARVAEHGEVWDVYDAYGNTIPLDVASQEPDRIAGIYFLHLGADANAACGTPDRVVTGPGYRHFYVGNAAMIASYEVGTEAIQTELGQNITALSQYMELTRPCPTLVFQPSDANVICFWGYNLDPFLDALSSAGPRYEPTAAALADLIEALEDSLFTPDPYIGVGGSAP